jgi:hypothetical protein
VGVAHNQTEIKKNLETQEIERERIKERISILEPTREPRREPKDFAMNTTGKKKTAILVASLK